MAKRIQSPSSINIYKQCPRKYYYQYHLKLKTAPSIHTVRGNIAHSVLEDIFDLDVSALSKENFKSFLHQEAMRLLIHHWRAKSAELDKLPLTTEEFQFYFEETNLMMINWVNKFSEKVLAHPSSNFGTIFSELTPVREKFYHNKELWVRGYVDAIEVVEGKVRVMDYKTSKRFKMSAEYQLQLGIYALMYQEEHGEAPHQVGIYFLKDTGQHEHLLDVTQDMIDAARAEVEVVHMNTESDKMGDYPKRESPLCKWRTGQCDFYDICFGQKTLEEYAPNVKLPSGNTPAPQSAPSHSQSL